MGTAAWCWRPEQPEALAVYRRRGYRSIPNHGAHEVALAFHWTPPAVR